jgi:hypothetical protein
VGCSVEIVRSYRTLTQQAVSSLNYNKRAYCLLFDFFQFLVGVVVRVDSGVVDANESNRHGVSVRSRLSGGGDGSNLVVPVCFLALDADLVSALDFRELGKRDTPAVKGSGGKGRDRNSEEKKREEELDCGEHGGAVRASCSCDGCVVVAAVVVVVDDAAFTMMGGFADVLAVLFSRVRYDVKGSEEYLLDFSYVCLDG